MPRINYSVNMNAFLDTIAFAEGTIKFGKDDGYDVLVGGTTFNDYSRHPNVKIKLPKMGIISSAAGRYQILGWVARHYMRQLRLIDFRPKNQDIIAIQLIRECGALDEIERGEIHKAIRLCSSRWASFPGNDYGQRKESIAKMVKHYADKGGKLCQISTTR